MPIANVCLQHKSTFEVHYRTGSPGQLGLRVAGLPGRRWVTKFDPVPCLLYASLTCYLIEVVVDVHCRHHDALGPDQVDSFERIAGRRILTNTHSTIPTVIRQQTEAAQSAVNSFVVSRTVYCNCLPVGCPRYQLDRLQAVMNTAARLIFHVGKYNGIKLLLPGRLLWLPVPKRIQFELCLLVIKAVNGFTPPYLSELCRPCPLCCREEGCVLQVGATSSSTRQSPTSDGILFLSLLRRPGMNCRTLCQVFRQ